MESCLDRCLTAKESESEWRTVPFRFTSTGEPAEGQIGSTDNGIKTSKSEHVAECLYAHIVITRVVQIHDANVDTERHIRAIQEARKRLFPGHFSPDE